MANSLNQKRVANLTKKEKPKYEASPQSARIFNREAKLLQYTERVDEWVKTGTTIPINVAIDPTFTCNHRCPGCHGLMGQDNTVMDTDRLLLLLDELKSIGVQGVMLAGAGEPTMHPDFARVLLHCGNINLDAAYYTNGELLTEQIIDATLDSCSWIRVSLDASNEQMHNSVHRAGLFSFEKVTDNMKALSTQRQKKSSKTTLGAGFLVNTETALGIYDAAKLTKDLGFDYLRVRPFFGYNNKPMCDVSDIPGIVKQLDLAKSIESDSFTVDFPEQRMSWVETGNPDIQYHKCYIHHFSTHIGADLNVYLCCHTIGWQKYALGNLNENTFEEIWYSQKRRDVYESIDYRDCATPCSMAQFNNQLEKFKSPVIHPNFI